MEKYYEIRLINFKEEYYKMWEYTPLPQLSPLTGADIAAW